MSKATHESSDSLEQLREILVGSVQRDLERRFTRGESNSAQRVAELQQEVRRRIDVIEAHMKREIDALTGRISGEVLETKEAFRALARENREATTALEQRVAKLEEALSRAQHDLRQQILSQAKSFIDELQELRGELKETLDRELGALDVDEEEESVRRGHSASAPAATT